MNAAPGSFDLAATVRAASSLLSADPAPARPLLYALWVRLPLGSVTSRYTGLPTPPVQSSISQDLHKRSSLPEARFLHGPQ